MIKQGAIPGYETATPEEQHERMREIFRNVFMSDEGRIVFNIILDDLNFFKPARDEAERARNEYAKFLISDRMGFEDTFSLSNKLLEGEYTV